MIVILGGGLAGLSAGYRLVREGEEIVVLERDRTVGGLAKTVGRDGFYFDLGGHRFITKDRGIETLVRELLKEDLLQVSRKSRIFLQEKYFDYPLKPANALFGLGLSTTVRILCDYARQRLRGIVSPPEIVSLEDWVVSRFGRRMFEIYFKQYSEKVWGIDCSSISQEWVSQRIKGLSLWEALKNAFFRFSGRHIDTLADTFLYPSCGIGEMAERLKMAIVRRNSLHTGASVQRIRHDGSYVKSVTISSGDEVKEIEGGSFVSTIPLPELVQMLDPGPPADVLKAVSRLHYRDLVVVTLLLRRERITDLTWLYLPERRIPLGRIHEPKNWSARMAPEGHTSLVAEFFCFRGDRIWNARDERLTSVTVKHLEQLGFIGRDDVAGSVVVRVPHAYPLLDVEYRKHYHLIMNYLGRFRNLQVAGRTGTFQYLNMDRAMRSGIDAAENILSGEYTERPGVRNEVYACHTGLGA